MAKNNGDKTTARAKKKTSQADASSAPDNPQPKTHLSASDLEKFKTKLLAKRQQLVGDVDRMKDDALKKSRRDASGDLSSMPIHMADIGTDNYEQELTVELIENEQTVLREIDEALARIEDNTYGICLATGKRISKVRLKVKPWAKYCVGHRGPAAGPGPR